MEPVNVLAQVGVIAWIIAKVIERIRVRLPRIDGDLVSVVSITAGSLIAWAYGLDVSFELVGTSMVEPFNWIVSGVAIGTGAGLVADVTGSLHRSGRPELPTTPPPGEAHGADEVVIDENTIAIVEKPVDPGEDDWTH
jgi:hypothetical protein